MKFTLPVYFKIKNQRGISLGYREWESLPIAGEWIKGSSKSYYDNINPYNNDLLVRLKTS